MEQNDSSQPSVYCFRNDKKTANEVNTIVSPTTQSESVGECEALIRFLMVWGPHEYTTTGFGLGKIRKWLVYTISWCICKVPEIQHFQKTPPRSVYIQPAVFWAVCLNTKKWYTPTIFSSPKPGGYVNIYIYIYIYIYAVSIIRLLIICKLEEVFRSLLNQRRHSCDN